MIGLLGALAALAVAFDPVAEAARLQANPPAAGAAQPVHTRILGFTLRCPQNSSELDRNLEFPTESKNLLQSLEF